MTDSWGFTDLAIPPAERANPLEGRGVSVSIEVVAPAEAVWDLVTDINTPSRHCKEAAGASWDAPGPPGMGSTFKGKNATDDTGHPSINGALVRMLGGMEWETPCTVTIWDQARHFAYAVGDAESPWALWGFVIEPTGGDGVRLEHYMVHGAGVSGTGMVAAESPEDAEDIVAGRFRCIRDNLLQVVEGVKREAEGTAQAAGGQGD